MSYHPDRSETKPSGLPRAPSRCSVSGCTEDAHLLFIVVLDGSREVCGSFGDFGYSTTTNAGTVNFLRDGYHFVRWIARCHEHYDRDLYRLRKGKWSPISGTNPLLSKEDVDTFHAEREATSSREAA